MAWPESSVQRKIGPTAAANTARFPLTRESALSHVVVVVSVFQVSVLQLLSLVVVLGAVDAISWMLRVEGPDVDYLMGMLLPPTDASGPRMSAGADIIKTDPHIMRLPA